VKIDGDEKSGVGLQATLPGGGKAALCPYKIPVVA
jgi:hypothetical protein